MFNLLKAYLKPPLLMCRKNIHRKLFGYKKYEGNFETITKKIVLSSFVHSKKYPSLSYLQVSSGHYRQFYCRDFGMITEYLLKENYDFIVKETLKYALFVFQKYHRITTTISEDVPVNFFSYGSDSLPFLMRSLRVYYQKTKDDTLILKYQDFLQKMIDEYYAIVYDIKSKLIKENIFLSSAKDHSNRRSGTYENSAMIGLAIELKKINTLLDKELFQIPISIEKSTKEMKKHLYDKKGFFYDDLDRKKIKSADANIFPYYWNIFQNKKMITSSLEHIQNLAKQLPIQYTLQHDTSKEIFWSRLISPNFEGNTIWMHIGLCYIEVLQKIDDKECSRLLQNYKTFVEKRKNSFEVLSLNKRPYQSFFYTCDESMTWIVGYYSLSKKN